jgi:hypothetical protein
MATFPLGRRLVCATVGLALVVLGARCAWIDFASVELPGWDQWTEQHLVRAMGEGQFTMSDLAQPHNEHGTFTTRLTSLVLMLLSGYWDLMGELVASAAVTYAVAALLFGALWLFARWEPVDDAASTLATVLLLAALLSMAGGVPATLAAAATLLLRAAAARTLGTSRASLVLLLIALGGAEHLMTPECAEYERTSWHRSELLSSVWIGQHHQAAFPFRSVASFSLS